MTVSSRKVYASLHPSTIQAIGGLLERSIDWLEDSVKKNASFTQENLDAHGIDTACHCPQRWALAQTVVSGGRMHLFHACFPAEALDAHRMLHERCGSRESHPLAILSPLSAFFPAHGVIAAHWPQRHAAASNALSVRP